MVGQKFVSLAAWTLALTAVNALPDTKIKPRLVNNSPHKGRATVPAVRVANPNYVPKRTVSSIDVASNWYIEAWIGTPGASFLFLGDSGAPNLSIESTLEPPEAQGDIPKYDPTKSSTAKQMDGYTYSECFGSGYCDNGVVYTDIFTVGTLAYEGMPIMVQTNNTSPSNGVRSGNMGLNIDPNGMTTTPKRLPSYFQTIMPALDAPLWTVDFRASTGTGEFTFGAIDTSKYTGTVAYGPVTTTGGLWTVEVQGIGAGYDASAYKPFQFQVVFDTGTGGGSISREIADLYWSQVPNAVYNDDWANYLYPCDQTLPDFVVQLADGNKVGIPADGLYSKTGDNGMCVTMLAIADGNDTLWGQAWIEKWFLIFDYGNKRVGVANKSQ